jgi:hypothetical protein
MHLPTAQTCDAACCVASIDWSTRESMHRPSLPTSVANRVKSQGRRTRTPSPNNAARISVKHAAVRSGQPSLGSLPTAIRNVAGSSNRKQQRMRMVYVRLFAGLLWVGLMTIATLACPLAPIASAQREDLSKGTFACSRRSLNHSLKAFAANSEAVNSPGQAQCPTKRSRQNDFTSSRTQSPRISPVRFR